MPCRKSPIAGCPKKWRMLVPLSASAMMAMPASNAVLSASNTRPQKRNSRFLLRQIERLAQDLVLQGLLAEAVAAAREADAARPDVRRPLPLLHRHRPP